MPPHCRVYSRLQRQDEEYPNDISSSNKKWFPRTVHCASERVQCQIYGKTLLQWYSETNSCDYDCKHTRCCMKAYYKKITMEKSFVDSRHVSRFQFPGRVENVPSSTHPWISLTGT